MFLQYINIPNLETRKKLVQIFFICFAVAALTNSLSNVIWVLVLFVIWTTLVEFEEKNEADFLTDMETKLAMINPGDKYEYLYYDVDVIELFVNMLEFESFSKIVWDDTLQHVNNFFNLYDDIVRLDEVLKTKRETYLAMIEEYKDIVAHFHSFVYAVPRSDPVYLEKYNQSFRQIRLYLRRYLEVAKKMVNEEVDVQDPVSSYDYLYTVDNSFYVA